MGYGLPAAIGAKLGNPQKDVIVISGDGGMQMNIQEMATAIVYELPIVICILNNGSATVASRIVLAHKRGDGHSKA